MKNSTPSRTRAGFTLIEIMVVIALIALLALGIGKAQPSVESALNGAVRSLGGLVKVARAEAAQRAVKSRILIGNLNANTENYLHFAGIAVWQEENKASGQTAGWIATTSNVTLPGGIYFSWENMEKYGKAGGSGKPDTMKFDFTKSEPQDDNSGTEEFYYYEFSPEGSTENGAGARIVISPGTPSGDNGKLEFDNEKLAGLVIHQTGATSVARDTEDLK